ncbi:hypothetical protein RA29_19065 [Tateyamaria sp. ANG-S1]|nr:hypothetical protein RA29_19065 [Tateyamaria sp. ANG-S1]
MPTLSPLPTVAVLMATFNGGRDVVAQLDSIASQTHLPDLILISDDGSKDATCTHIDAFAAAHPDIPVMRIDGPQQGATRNFLHLLIHTPDEIDVVAFCDQDDVWLDHKLARGLEHLKTADTAPTLYCARTWVCDVNLNKRRMSRFPKAPPGFRNAIVQNIAAGNTIMLNRQALSIARRLARRTRKTVVHDWWLYQIITGIGGHVICDAEPVLLYRQHRNNLVGANFGLQAWIKRMNHVRRGGLRRWTTTNLVALRHASDDLTDENRAILAAFTYIRRKPWWRRVQGIYRLGLYRQRRLGQASLFAAAILGFL